MSSFNLIYPLTCNYLSTAFPFECLSFAFLYSKEMLLYSKYNKNFRLWNKKYFNGIIELSLFLKYMLRENYSFLERPLRTVLPVRTSCFFEEISPNCSVHMTSTGAKICLLSFWMKCTLLCPYFHWPRHVREWTFGKVKPQTGSKHCNVNIVPYLPKQKMGGRERELGSGGWSAYCSVLLLICMIKALVSKERKYSYGESGWWAFNKKWIL